MSLNPFAKKAAIAIVSLLVCKFVANAYSEPVNQATVEAAITLQLLSFTEWPPNETREEAPPRKIGVFRSEEHFAAFEALTSDERYIDLFALCAIEGDPSSEDLDRLDAIFFHQPEDTAIPRIIRKLENRPVVLIGAFDGFLEQGGMVELVKSQKRLSFEIQLVNSKRSGIEYRAKLLRLAAKIIDG